MAYTNTYTKEEQKALAIEKVKRTLAKIKTDVVSVFDVNSFPDYLEFVARFHYFDVNNTVLVYGQNPTATFLASFKAWEQFGLECWGDPKRPVFATSQKGKGIGLLAPYILKKSAEDVPGGRQAISYFDYHVVFVFDKEQTNNIPLPFLPWDLANNEEDSRALFHAFNVGPTFNITFENRERSFRYLYTPPAGPDAKGSLVLNSLDAENYYLLCSYVLKNYVVQHLRARLKTSSEDEFQRTSECVTFVLASYFGLPRDREAFFFVKLWGRNDPVRMLNVLNRVQTLSHVLIEMLEEELVFQKSLNNIEDIYDDDEIFDIGDVYGFNQF